MSPPSLEASNLLMYMKAHNSLRPVQSCVLERHYAPLQSNYWGRQVNLKLLGSDSSYVVHDELLYYASNIIKLIQVPLSNASIKPAYVQDWDVEKCPFTCLENVISWLYTGSLAVATDQSGEMITAKDQVRPTIGQYQRLPLVYLYNFARINRIPRLKNHIIDAHVLIFIERDGLPEAEDVALAWKLLPDDDNLLDLFVDLYFWGGLADSSIYSKESAHKLPKEFMRRILEIQADGRHAMAYRDRIEWMTSVCEYHDHAGHEMDDPRETSLAQQYRKHGFGV